MVDSLPGLQRSLHRPAGSMADNSQVPLAGRLAVVIQVALLQRLVLQGPQLLAECTGGAAAAVCCTSQAGEGGEHVKQFDSGA